MKTIKFLCLPVFISSLLLLTSVPFTGCDPKDKDKDEDTLPVAYKPNIYLYPRETTQLNIQVVFPKEGEILASSPEYGSGWNITVEPNGLIDKNYHYLFYESRQPDVWQTRFGWVVKKEDLKVFFTGNMALYGFRGREITDFTDYWIPRLTAYDLYVVYPQDAANINEVIQLKFSKEPDHVLRLFYLIKGMNDDSDAKPLVPARSKILERSGFFVAEWGMIISE